MPRLRIHFLKRGFACFISHIDLPILFSRAAKRAGLEAEQTQGFSPHPRTALGPPLPVGVRGLAEPADFWFTEWFDGADRKWSDNLPNELEIVRAEEVEGVSLNKLCKAAGYDIRPMSGASASEISFALGEALKEAGSLLDIAADGESVKVFVSDIERASASRMVKILVSSGIVSGWGDLAIARTGVGGWDGENKKITGV